MPKVTGYRGESLTQSIKKNIKPRTKTDVLEIPKNLFLRMAKMALLAYKNTETKTSKEEIQFIEQLQNEGHRLTFFNDRSEFSGTVTRKGKEMAISYHGTQSRKNLIADFKLFKRPTAFARGNVHKGFYDAFLESKDILDAIFNEQVDQMLMDFLLDKNQLIGDIKKRLETLNRGLYVQLLQDLKVHGCLEDRKTGKALILEVMQRLQDLDDCDLELLLEKISQQPQMKYYRNDPSMIIFREILQHAVIKQAKITFSGHSFGGAESSIAALYYTKKYKLDSRNIEVFTFASPRLFDFTMAKEYEALLGDVTYRVSELHQDIITALPLGIMNFKHVGKNVRLKKSSKDIFHSLIGYKNAMEKWDDDKKIKFDNRASWVNSKLNPLFYLRYLLLLPQHLSSYLKEVIYTKARGKDDDIIS